MQETAWFIWFYFLANEEWAGLWLFKSLFMKNCSLDPNNILLRDQRVVKMHLFFTRKMMVGSNFLLVIHIPQGMEVSKSTVVLIVQIVFHSHLKGLYWRLLVSRQEVKAIITQLKSVLSYTELITGPPKGSIPNK